MPPASSRPQPLTVGSGSDRLCSISRPWQKCHRPPRTPYRRAIAAREACLAARLRAVEHAYHTALDRDTALQPPSARGCRTGSGTASTGTGWDRCWYSSDSGYPRGTAAARSGTRRTWPWPRTRPPPGWPAARELLRRRVHQRAPGHRPVPGAGRHPVVNRSQDPPVPQGDGTFDTGLVPLGGYACGSIARTWPTSPATPTWPPAAPGRLPTIRMPPSRTRAMQARVTVPAARLSLPWIQHRPGAGDARSADVHRGW